MVSYVLDLQPPDRKSKDYRIRAWTEPMAKQEIASSERLRISVSICDSVPLAFLKKPIIVKINPDNVFSTVIHDINVIKLYSSFRMQIIELDDKLIVSTGIRSQCLNRISSSGSKYLLCSDGLSNMVEDEDLFRIIRQDKDLQEIGGELLMKANRNGGLDNIAVVLVEIDNSEVRI